MVNYLSKLRQKAGLSIKGLSKLCGEKIVSESQLQRAEGGESKLTINKCLHIAKALNVTVEEIFTLEEDGDVLKLQQKKKAETLSTRDLLVGYTHVNDETRHFVSKIILREIKGKKRPT